MAFKKYKQEEELEYTLRPENRPEERRQPKEKLSFYQKVKRGAMMSRVGYEQTKRKIKAEKKSWTYILGGKGALISDIEYEKVREKAKLRSIRSKARSRSFLKLKKRGRPLVILGIPKQTRQARPQPILGEIDFGIPRQNFYKQKRRKR